MQPSPEEPDDDALMLAFAAGDARAFERLFRRHGSALLTYLAHLTGERAAAEDLLQEIFLRVVRRAREYRPDGRFRAWLHTIAHHALTDQRRRAALRPATSDVMETHDDDQLARLIHQGSSETAKVAVDAVLRDREDRRRPLAGRRGLAGREALQMPTVAPLQPISGE